jgi:hypothetical protein
MAKVARWFAVTFSVVLVLGTCTIGYGTQNAYGVVSIPISPSVFATIISAGDRLAFLVLWRGTPGWRSRATSGHRSESGGGSQAGVFNVVIEYGSIPLNLSYDSTAHRATLQRKPISVSPGTNVLLIDEVDSRAGPRLVKGLSLDPGDANVDPRRGSLATLLSRSSDIVSFLRCGDGETTAAIDQMACAGFTK